MLIRNHSETVRQVIEQSIPLRREGCTAEWVAQSLGLTERTYMSYTSTKSIRKHCPDLLDEFRESGAKEKEKGPKRPVGEAGQFTAELAQMLRDGVTLAEVWALAFAKGPQNAPGVTRAAMRRAYSDSRKYQANVKAMIAGEVPEPPPPHPSLTVAKVHARRKRPTVCDGCGEPGQLTKWGARGYFCRDCMCKDEVHPYDALCEVVRNNQIAIDEVYQ